MTKNGIGLVLHSQGTLAAWAKSQFDCTPSEAVLSKGRCFRPPLHIELRVKHWRPFHQLEFGESSGVECQRRLRMLGSDARLAGLDDHLPIVFSSFDRSRRLSREAVIRRLFDLAGILKAWWFFRRGAFRAQVYDDRTSRFHCVLYGSILVRPLFLISGLSSNRPMLPLARKFDFNILRLLSSPRDQSYRNIREVLSILTWAEGCIGRSFKN